MFTVIFVWVWDISGILLHFHSLGMYLLQASLNWVIIGPGNGFVPNRHKAITWTNDDFLSIGPLGTYFSKIWVEVENNFYTNNTKRCNASSTWCFIWTSKTSMFGLYLLYW